MVSEGQFVGLDWNRIARLHSQVLVSKKISLNHNFATVKGDWPKRINKMSLMLD